jgi:carbamoylphosphate synthase large subunit
VSKTLNVDFIELATKVILGVPYKSLEIPHLNYVGVKVLQFSFIRLKGVDPVLGVEMAFTGEVTSSFTHSSSILTF